MLRKFTWGYKFTKLQEKINYLMYWDNIKQFVKIFKKKRLDNLIRTIRMHGQDIRMEFGIEKCAMFIMKSGKRQIMKEIELLNQGR